MAISFGNVLNSINLEKIEAFEKIIDNKLNSCPQDCEWGIGDLKGYWVIIPGTFNSAEKRILVSRYTRAGWKDVRVKNSEDMEERHAGLVCIIFPFTTNGITNP